MLIMLIPYLVQRSSENHLTTRGKIHKITVHLIIKLIWSRFVQKSHKSIKFGLLVK